MFILEVSGVGGGPGAQNPQSGVKEANKQVAQNPQPEGEKPFGQIIQEAYKGTGRKPVTDA